LPRNLWDNLARVGEGPQTLEAGMTSSRLASRIVGAALAAVAASACGAGAPPESAEEAVTETRDWSYEGETGPARWGQLNADFATCATGSVQSPIALETPAGAAPPKVVFDYRGTGLTLVNNGHTVEVTYEPGSSIQLDGVRYDLRQFHFHGPSEHEVGGQEHPLEIHFVHQAADGGLAVVGALVSVGARHAALAPVFDNLPTTVDVPRTVLEAWIDANEFLPRSRSAYYYTGSLTTPPCTEGVRWIVLRNPISIDEQQLEQYRAVVRRNDRPTQPLNGRAVATDGN
jgi:carbonic anhydrase